MWSKGDKAKVKEVDSFAQAWPWPAGRVFSSQEGTQHGGEDITAPQLPSWDCFCPNPRAAKSPGSLILNLFVRLHFTAAKALFGKFDTFASRKTFLNVQFPAHPLLTQEAGVRPVPD